MRIGAAVALVAGLVAIVATLASSGVGVALAVVLAGILFVPLGLAVLLAARALAGAVPTRERVVRLGLSAAAGAFFVMGLLAVPGVRG